MIDVTRLKQQLRDYHKHVNILSSNQQYKEKMKKEIEIILSNSRRALALLAAIAMITFGSPAVALAANDPQGGQVQTRSIRMSDNGVSGGTIATGIGSGTNATYRVTFQAATDYTLKGIVVDFCDGDIGTPFMGDATCDLPPDFDISTVTVDPSNFGSATGIVTSTPVAWSAATSTAQTLILTNTEGVAVTTGTTYTFAVSGVTNTSKAGTFYARLMTYASNTGDITTYAHNDPGTYQDYGGFALSTAAIVQVTAKVQEALSFCVSGYSQVAGAGNAPSNCADATPPAITLGHGTNKTLDASQVDRNSVWTFTSSNALHGVTIRMHNSNTCGGLSTNNGTTCDIPAIGSGAAIPSAIVAGTAAFGMFCVNSSGGTGSINCDASYRTAGQTNTDLTQTDARWYGMDTTSTENVQTLYGDEVATSAGPINNVLNEYDFAATASNTTPAGIYTANLAMIATGSF